MIFVKNSKKKKFLGIRFTINCSYYIILIRYIINIFSLVNILFVIKIKAMRRVK